MNEAIAASFVEGIAFVGFFAAVVMVTKIFADNWTKRRLAAAHVSGETIKALYAGDREGTVLAALKWGLVFCGLGVALVVIQFLPYDFSDPIVYGLMLLLTGGALLVHHAVLGRVGQQHAPRTTPAAGPAERAGSDSST